jgi:hypothetical protein
VTSGFLPGCATFLCAIRRFPDEPSNTPEFAAHIANVAEEFRALSSVSADLYAKNLKSVRRNPCSQAFVRRRNGQRGWSFLLLFPARSAEKW